MKDEQEQEEEEELKIEYDSSSQSTNVAGNSLGKFRTDPLGFMIRLTSESSAFFQGEGWRAYQNYIGSRIFYAEYTEQIRSSVISGTRVQQAVKALANLKYEQEKQDYESKKIRKRTSLTVIEKQMHYKMIRILDGMLAEMSSIRTLRFVAFMVNNILVKMYHQGIHIKESEFLELKRVALDAEKRGISLILLPNHKSHVDYLVISYIFYRMGIALPHIAAGDNINLPVVGWLLKNTGAFFIRRQWGSDSLYNAIMKEYIEVLLKRGHNIEAFIEGTRSRIGKLLQPRYGILKIILDSVLSGRTKDCYIVPMSIGYDKVIETSAYVNELLGTPKEKETLFQLFSNLNILSFKWGRIDVRFAKPFSLKSYLNTQEKRRGESWNPLHSPEDLKSLLQSLSYRILSQINSVSVIMPTALVGTTLITLRGNGVGEEEMIRKVNWLTKKILYKGGRVADFLGMSTRTIIERAVQVLRKDLIGRRTDLLETVYYPVNRFELSFYRNQIIHLFVSEAILCVAMYSTVKAGGPLSVQRVPLSKLEKDVSFLSQLFKSEFVFGSGGVETNLKTTIQVLVDEEVVHVGSSGAENEFQDSWIELSSRERKCGRETFDFYCFLVWPFVETYWLATVSLFTILPKHGSNSLRWEEEKEFMNRALFFGKSLYYEGDISYLEAINKETLKNGFQRLEELGVVNTHFGSEPPSTHSVQSGVKSIVKWVSLSSEWIPPEALPEAFMISPSTHSSSQRYNASTNLDAPNVVTYSENSGPLDISIVNPSSESEKSKTGPLDIDEEVLVNESSYQEWTRIEPKGRLWELCEQIGAFRREGKNRRDTALVAARVLRLASMAGSLNVKKNLVAKL